MLVFDSCLRDSSTFPLGLKNTWTSGVLARYEQLLSLCKNESRKYFLSSTKNSFLLPVAYFGGTGGTTRPGYLSNKISLN